MAGITVGTTKTYVGNELRETEVRKHDGSRTVTTPTCTTNYSPNGIWNTECKFENGSKYSENPQGSKTISPDGTCIKTNNDGWMSSCN